MGQPAQIETLEQRWDELREIGSPPPLIADVFLANREAACTKLNEVFDDKMLQLRLDTYYPNQVADFIAAYVETLDKDSKLEVVGRCLIVPCAEAWDTITILLEPHILIADFDLDDETTHSRKRIVGIGSWAAWPVQGKPISLRKPSLQS